jgi:hypothetical protein
MVVDDADENICTKKSCSSSRTAKKEGTQSVSMNSPKSIRI